MSGETVKSKITRAEYLQLLGLQLIATKHCDALRDIERAARELVGSPNNVEYPSHLIDDAMWGSRTVDEVLRVCEIEVEPE